MKKECILIILFFLSLKIHSQILNMESYRLKEDSIGWRGKAGLDLYLTKNTKTLTKLSGLLHVQHKSTKDIILILAKYSLLSSDGQDLIDQSILHLRYNYYFKPNLIGEWFVQGQKNSISKIYFRGLFGAGLRLKLSDKIKTGQFYLGTAPMFEYEETTTSITEKLWRWSNYISFVFSPNKQFSLTSTTYYQPVFSAFADFRISSQNSLIFSMTTDLSFKTTFHYNYDSTPVAGIPNVQYNLSSGILYQF